MNLLWKLLAGCALVLTLLCAPGEAHAVLKGSDGQCTPGYHPDPNDPNECIVDATELKKVWITGNTPLNWSFDSAFFGISDYNRVAL